MKQMERAQTELSSAVPTMKLTAVPWTATPVLAVERRTQGDALIALRPRNMEGRMTIQPLKKGLTPHLAWSALCAKIEAKQDEAIDAALDVTGTSGEGAVKVVEEAYWGSALSTDGDAGGCLDEGTHGPGRHPVAMVEPANQAAAPRREAACSQCEREFYSSPGKPICCGCRSLKM